VGDKLEYLNIADQSLQNWQHAALTSCSARRQEMWREEMEREKAGRGEKGKEES